MNRFVLRPSFGLRPRVSTPLCSARVGMSLPREHAGVELIPRTNPRCERDEGRS